MSAALGCWLAAAHLSLGSFGCSQVKERKHYFGAERKCKCYGDASAAVAATNSFELATSAQKRIISLLVAL